MPCHTFLVSMPGGSEWILILLVVFPLYFLPTIVATSRKNPNTGPIFALNLLLGWTFIGWLGALIWALSSRNSQNPSIVVNNTSQISPQETTERPIAHQDKIDQLRQLKQLLDEGILTTEEFNKQKVAILG